MEQLSQDRFDTLDRKYKRDIYQHSGSCYNKAVERIIMIKSTVRKEFLQRRMNLPEEDLQQQTRLIASGFRTIKLPPVNYLMSYNPLASRHEFDVSICEDILKEQNMMLRVAWPKFM